MKEEGGELSAFGAVRRQPQLKLAMSIKVAPGRRRDPLVVLIVAALSAYHLATLARLSLQESAVARRAAAAGDLPARARGRARREGSLRGAARGRRRPLAAPVQRRLLAATSPTRRSSTARASRSRTASRPKKGKPMPEQEDLPPILGRSAVSLLRTVYFRPHVRDPAAAAVRRPGVRIDPDRHLDAAGEERAAAGVQDGDAGRAARAGHLHGRRDAAGAVDAAADPRDPERPDAPRARRARRPPRSAGRGGVQGSRQLVRRRQRAALRVARQGAHLRAPTSSPSSTTSRTPSRSSVPTAS